MGERGSLSGFTASPNFSKERAQRVYQNALDVGFSKLEALERVRAAQDIETILAGWPKLTDTEKQEIRDAVG